MAAEQHAEHFPSELQPHNFQSFSLPAEGLSGLRDAASDRCKSLLPAVIKTDNLTAEKGSGGGGPVGGGEKGE